jgi:SWI/SNF-related matrix-associated actin-dependent regulator 1 of chromatin subfamily A
MPEKLFKSLFKFQLEGLIFGVKSFGRVLLADEMGIGKTLQAIAIAWYFRNDWPLLIVVPSFLKQIWRLEILKWLYPDVTEKDIQIIESAKDRWRYEASVYILSYDLAHKVEQDLKTLNFKCCIADEAHFLKSRDSKRSLTLLPILTQARRTILLTGTPMMNRPCELFNLLKALRPDLLRSFLDYAWRYCDPKERDWGIDNTGCSKEREL